MTCCSVRSLVTLLINYNNQFYQSYAYSEYVPE